MRDVITWQELRTAMEAQELDPKTQDQLVDKLKTVQTLEVHEEVKKISALTPDDEGKKVWLRGRELTGTLYHFAEEGEFMFLSIDFKIQKFPLEDTIILQRSFVGADTMVDEG